MTWGCLTFVDSSGSVRVSLRAWVCIHVFLLLKLLSGQVPWSEGRKLLVNSLRPSFRLPILEVYWGGEGEALSSLKLTGGSPGVFSCLLLLNIRVNWKKSPEDESGFHPCQWISMLWWSWFGCGQKCPCGVQCLRNSAWKFWSTQFLGF